MIHSQINLRSARKLKHCMCVFFYSSDFFRAWSTLEFYRILFAGDLRRQFLSSCLFKYLTKRVMLDGLVYALACWLKYCVLLILCLGI